MRFILTLTIFITLASCKSADKVKANSPVSSTINGADVLTVEGENQYPRIHPDGLRMLYSSKKRSGHKISQVYELNLQTLKSRRVTFNDGETIGAGWIPESNEIFYQSTTDEIKENPVIVQKKMGENAEPFKLGYHDPFLTSEIYRSTPEGETIQRITDRSGFDGYATWVNKNELFYISQDKQQFQIQHQENGKSKLIFKAAQPIVDLKYNPKEKSWVWIQSDNTKKTNDVVIARKSLSSSTITALPSGYYRDPVWITGSNQIILSAKMQNKKDFDIYHLDLNSNCLKELVANKGDDIQPDIDSRNSFIVFTNQGETGRQIYRKTFNIPNGTCL